MWKQVGHFAAVGMEIGIAMALGVLGGRYLDARFDTAPLFFWFGFVVGVGAAVKAVVDAARMARRDMNNHEF